jgi:hypothetical protein
MSSEMQQSGNRFPERWVEDGCMVPDVFGNDLNSIRIPLIWWENSSEVLRLEVLPSRMFRTETSKNVMGCYIDRKAKAVVIDDSPLGFTRQKPFRLSVTP